MDRESAVCSFEVNFYFLADRTFTLVLLPAAHSAREAMAQSERCHSQKGWGVTSHSRLAELG